MLKIVIRKDIPSYKYKIYKLSSGFNRCPKEKALATRLRRGFVFLNGKTYKDKESFEFRDELTYKCKKGFTLSGPSKVVCSGIGKWKPLNQGKPVCSELFLVISKHLSKNEKQS